MILLLDLVICGLGLFVLMLWFWLLLVVMFVCLCVSCVVLFGCSRYWCWFVVSLLRFVVC